MVLHQVLLVCTPHTHLMHTGVIPIHLRGFPVFISCFSSQSVQHHTTRKWMLWVCDFVLIADVNPLNTDLDKKMVTTKSNLQVRIQIKQSNPFSSEAEEI